MSNPALRVGIVGYGIVGKRCREFIDSHPGLTVVAMSYIKFESERRDSDIVRKYRQD